MKDYLADQLRTLPDPLHARNLAREYLQARILGCLQRIGAMVPLAFHGGTALRFLYGTPRYSEDLDFTLEQARDQYNFRAYLRAIRSELATEGYTIELKVNDQKVVHGAFIRFGGLLHELGISPHQGEILSIKLEVDTNPPLGAALTTSVIRRFVALQLQHHDRASLLAGKIHAILQRSYTKGRDIYDLLWYLSDPDWPEPNFALLNSALQQTNWSGDKLNEENWRQILGDRLQTLSWERVVNDVRPFLETDADVGLLTRGNLLRLVDSD